MDVLRVTAGQDHGARFGLRGDAAVIGRGPLMDVVLTDPRVAPRHAEVRVEGGRLVVEDLGGGGGTRVNGAPALGPTPLVAGDRITLGGTEVTVLWTPQGTLLDAGPPPAPAVAPIGVDRGRRSADDHPGAHRHGPIGPRGEVQSDHERRAAPAAQARPEVLLPVACICLAGFALLATWMPALGGAWGTDSIWRLDPGARVQAILAALLVGGLATGWLGAQARGRRSVVPLLAAGTAVAGGVVAGLPLFLAAVDLRGSGARAGVALLILAGLATAACALAGLALATQAPPPPAPDVAALWTLGAGGIAGSTLAILASPLDWISIAGHGLGGVGGGGIAAGRALIIIALATACACAVAVAAARARRPQRALLAAVAATALAGCGLAFTAGGAMVLGDWRMQAGLSLALAGTAIAVAATLIGAGTLALAAGDDPSDGSHIAPGGAHARQA